MRTTIEKILRLYGKGMLLRHEGREYPVEAFWQVAIGKTERHANLQPGIIGLEDKTRYIYIGPMEPVAAAGDTVVVDGKEFLVRDAQVIYGGSEGVYRWGICAEKGGVPSWEMNG